MAGGLSKGPTPTGIGSAGTRRLFDEVARTVPFSLGFVVSTMPRAGLRLLQPGRLPRLFARTYSRTAQGQDVATWRSILAGRPVRDSEMATGEEAGRREYREFLRGHGVAHELAVPLAGPVLYGYPGALVLLRGHDEGDFSEADVERLKDRSAELDTLLNEQRPQRNRALPAETWTPTAPIRMFIFADEGKLIYPQAGLLPARVEQQLSEQARRWLQQIHRGAAHRPPAQPTDENGQRWPFRLEMAEVPALGKSPLVMAALRPEPFEWQGVQTWEVAGDEDLARLLPAIRHMIEEYGAGPTLRVMATKAHLSAGHFHRRFADLVGMTPKEFLLACQIHQAKRMLTERRPSLREIARQCGFANQSHLSVRFAQAVGLAPTRWRKLAAERDPSPRG